MFPLEFASRAVTEGIQKLAPKYFNTRFCRVFVENIPWLVERLSIKVLPCVVCFVNGVTKDKYDEQDIWPEN